MYMKRMKKRKNNKTTAGVKKAADVCYAFFKKKNKQTRQQRPHVQRVNRRQPGSRGALIRRINARQVAERRVPNGGKKEEKNSNAKKAKNNILISQRSFTQSILVFFFCRPVSHVDVLLKLGGTHGSWNQPARHHRGHPDTALPGSDL